MSANNKKKQLIVQMNHEGAGFWVYLQFVLNGFIICNRNKDKYYEYPKIDFGENNIMGKNLYFDKTMNEDNFFNYFFELKINNTYGKNIEYDKLTEGQWWYVHLGKGYIKAYPDGCDKHLQQFYDTKYLSLIHI